MVNKLTKEEKELLVSFMDSPTDPLHDIAVLKANIKHREEHINNLKAEVENDRAYLLYREKKDAMIKDIKEKLND